MYVDELFAIIDNNFAQQYVATCIQWYNYTIININTYPNGSPTTRKLTLWVFAGSSIVSASDSTVSRWANWTFLP